MRRAALLLLLSVACGGAARPAETRTDIRLVVLIVIDQLPSWQFFRREKLFRGGIARLLREGRVYEKGRYPFAVTYTGPGHTALATGAPPSETGIVANTIYDRRLEKAVANVQDPEHEISPMRLRVPAVADGMTRGQAVSISLKGRSAVLLGGHRPAAAIWWDEKAAGFATSSYYASPPWLASIPTFIPPGPWKPRDPALLARETGGPDDAPGEGSYDGLGPTFPHEVVAKALKYSPAADALLLGAALTALREGQLGKHDQPDFLAISFSAHDYAGHLWGQDSWEILDLLLRLDEQIGVLLDAVDAQVGPNRSLVVLTSDHGAPRLIERLGRGRRLPVGEVRVAAERAARSLLGPGDWVLWPRDPSIYLAPAAQRDDVLDRVAEAVRQVPGVGFAYRTDRMSGGCDARPVDDAAICRSLAAGVSGDIFWGVSEGSIVVLDEPYPVNHGSRYDYDTTVPILIMGPGFRRGRVREPVSMLRVAPTLAQALDVPPPAAALDPPL